MNAYRVLQVEDEPDIRDVVKLSLVPGARPTVKNCDNGPDALAEATVWRPDIILVDVEMPVMDTPEMLTCLRERSCTTNIPAVFMTERAQPSAVQHFLALGAAGMIAKPFDPLTMAASLRAGLGRQSGAT